MATYTVQASDLWDNGYDNVNAPRQSCLARFVFTTTDASVTVNGTTTWTSSFATFAHIGVIIDGIPQSSLIFSGSGAESFSVTLGSAGVSKTVELVSGPQTKSTDVLGSFIDSVEYADSFAVVPPTIGKRVLFYGDSITIGQSASPWESNGFAALLRHTYGYRTMLEAWGIRYLGYDCSTAGARTAFAGRIAAYAPRVIWLAIGTNDYGMSAWTATNFGVAYADMVDKLHAALPKAKIVCQTPLTRADENNENANGDSLPEYRTAITSLCESRSWAALVNGPEILELTDLQDGLHPTTAGHAKYAQYINTLLPSLIPGGGILIARS